MKTLQSLIVTIIALLLGILSCTPSVSPIPSEAPQPTTTQETTGESLIQASVVGVIDGDTIDVDIDGRVYRVRYIGVDTPERGQVGYEEATFVNTQLVSNGVVWLEKDIS